MRFEWRCLQVPNVTINHDDNGCMNHLKLASCKHCDRWISLVMSYDNAELFLMYAGNRNWAP